MELLPRGFHLQGYPVDCSGGITPEGRVEPVRGRVAFWNGAQLRDLKGRCKDGRRGSQEGTGGGGRL
ncbi:hypothetical protein TRIP_B50133 [uncultured Desulfatiglans sp.]|uniref:Uncharacterized protein n=1 Tax=Uncultured Desulfatiglans sp. TaxID=1748965 RepID=A0A653AGA4_UNCDX|nr:hypothetical protein TRIP_B50133 [uncultured Desulfatiglans sp.]